MADNIPTIISTEAQNVRDFINSKWDQSKTYAQTAFEEAISFIERMAHMAFDIDFDEPDITWDNIVFDLDTTLPTKPTLPDIEFRDPGALPVKGALQEFPGIVFPTSLFNRLSANVLTQVIAKLQAGGTGLGTEVENAIWENARARQAVANQEKYAEAENYFAARGFDLPPGALSGRLAQLQAEIMRSEEIINRDIAAKSADMALDYQKFVENLSYMVATGYEKSVIDRIVSSNKNIIDVFLGEMEGYKANVQAEGIRIDALAKVTTALMDGYKADIQAFVAKIDAKIREIEAKIKVNLGRADIQEKIAEIKVKIGEFVYGLQAEFLKQGAQVCAQLAASALQSVNASVNTGFSAGATEGAQFSESHAYDETKAVMGEEEKWIHNFDETG